MPFATGPWHTGSEFPNEGRTLCLVQMVDRYGVESHHAMRCNRYEWYFEDGARLGGGHSVLRWAYITDSVESMSALGQLPDEEQELPFERQETVHERALLLAAYVTELKSDLQRMHDHFARLDIDHEHHLKTLKAQIRQDQKEHEIKVRNLQRELLKMREQNSALKAMLKEVRKEMQEALLDRKLELKALKEEVRSLKEVEARILPQGEKSLPAHSYNVSVLNQKKEIARLIALAEKTRVELKEVRAELMKERTRSQLAQQKIEALQQGAYLPTA